MLPQTEVMQRLNLSVAIVQAPLAGGGDTPELVAAVSEAGALGSIGAAYLSPQQITATGRAVRQRTARPFAMDGRGIAAALALGAAGAQIGTAFLTCDESGVPDAYKQEILSAQEDRTRITRAFSGRPARGIVNRFMTEAETAAPDAILPFPLQNAITRPLRSAAAQQGRAEFLSLWAGQGVRLARRGAASALVVRLAVETEEAIARLVCAPGSQAQ